MPITPSTGPAHSNSTQNNEASQAQEIQRSEETVSGEESDAAEETSGPTDRLEISDAARAAHEKLGGEDAAIVQRGRQALQEASLSEDRISELQEEVSSGTFTELQVTEEVAAELANDIL